MKRIPPNAKWSGLSPENLAALESWLLDDQLTYDDALLKARNEFGYTGSRSGLQRLYQRRLQERMLNDLTVSAAHTDEILSAPGTEAALRHSGMKLLAQQFMRKLIANGSAELPTLARLVLHSEANENQRQKNEIRREALELRRQRMNFQVKVWQFDLIKSAMDLLPELNELAEERQRRSDPYAENKRLNAIRHRMFGNNVTPEFAENDEEQAFRDAHYEKHGGDWHRLYLEAKTKERQPVENPEAPATAENEDTNHPAAIRPEPAATSPEPSKPANESDTIPVRPLAKSPRNPS